ncbi:MAG TPA: CoA-binding protein [Candidatus Marinimicrobia bacterium]|nr:CoA-binding protein [Candidatus Neomarinimicrobiota bacterium]
MSHHISEAGLIEKIFHKSKTIAVVGLSPNAARPSYGVARFLQNAGYRIIPVNPTEAEILGKKCYPSLSSIPDDIKIDVVDIFRRPEFVPDIVRKAIQRGVSFIWLQDGVISEEAWDLAVKAQIPIVMDDCMYRQGIHYINK